jgi:hypothetical protein
MASADSHRPELLVCVINDPRFLDDVLAALLEAGITGATVLESQGMGRLLSQDMPIFASFRHLLTGSKAYTYTILAPVEEAQVTAEVARLVRDVLADAPAEDRGFLFALPLTTFVDLSSDQR